MSYHHHAMMPGVRRIVLSLLAGMLLAQGAVSAQGIEDDPWYANPLGFSPLSLHTRNGFLVPALAVGAILLFTDADSSITDRWRLYQEGGISIGYKPPYSSVWLGNVGVLYRARRWMEIGLEFSVYHPRDQFNDTWGMGVRPVARFYPVNEENIRIYFESGAGLVYFAEPFPAPSSTDRRLGTNLNGSPKYGLGGEVLLKDDLYLLFGVRHVHVSNGNTIGVERNPSHDSNGFYLGFIYTP